ncbi:MAG: hypothetical protein JNL58_11975 [Planctomyces sp.]|nr:hypothetical protein [Planctomyces sp.]
MRIIPVIDVRDGIAVHAVGGHRDYYRPVESAVSESSDPVRMLTVLKRRFQIGHCYVADLNGLQHRKPAKCQLAEMSRVGVPLLIDVGVRTVEDIEDLQDVVVDRIILGSETVPSLSFVRECVTRFGADRLTFSVDMRDGAMLTENPDWQGMAPGELAGLVIEAGIRELILLDLAAIGTGRGVSTLPLCRQLRQRFSSLSVIVGGGIRSVSHLHELEQAGADGALVATALHNGTITLTDFQKFGSGRLRTA